MARGMDLTDELWALIEPLLAKAVTSEGGKGRPRVDDDRSEMNGVVWVLRTGACWADLPDLYPSGSTCFRRFSHWVKTGALQAALEKIAQHIEAGKRIDLSECFIDGTFVMAKKRGLLVGKTKRGKGTKLIVVAEAAGLPISVHTAFASPHELTLVEATLDEAFTLGRPRRIIGDCAFDADALDERLKAKGIRLIAPHRSKRVKAKAQEADLFGVMAEDGR